MQRRDMDAARDALIAIRGIAGDALSSPGCVKPPHPRIARLTRPELAYGLKRLQHAELVHYLRCDATREVLLMIRQAAEETLFMLDEGDEEVCDGLEMVEPYRHHLYARATVAALRASEREAIKRDSAFWRSQNAAQRVSVRSGHEQVDSDRGDAASIALRLHRDAPALCD